MFSSSVFAQTFTWSPPVPITTADAALNQPGYVVNAQAGGAECFSSGDQIVNYSGGSIDFHVSCTTASVNGQGPVQNMFFHGDTGNAAFNNVLAAAKYDGNPNQILLHGLFPGCRYTVQLFVSDDRNGPSTRTVSFQGANDTAASAVVAESPAFYVMGSFTATSSDMVIRENLLVGAGNINALVVRQLNFNLTVNSGSGSGAYIVGQGTAIAANPIFYHNFSGWSGPNVANPNSPVTSVTVYSNTAVTANYVSELASNNNMSVSDFGAVGDGVYFYANTVSNSVILQTANTNTGAAVGKVVEAFGVGPWVYYNGNVVVTQQDIICTITNVVNGTNIYMSVPAGWTVNNTCCFVGTNNAAAFQAAINMASNSIAIGENTNVTINVPPGAYLLLPTNIIDPNFIWPGTTYTTPALTLSSGGITFLGQNATNTVLLGCGAGMTHGVDPSNMYPSGAPPFMAGRACIFFCSGPVMNSQYPLVFQNLTMDGGVQNGLQNSLSFPPAQIDGVGWDQTHSAVFEVDPTGTGMAQMHQLKVYTNCIIAHWRGEMLKSGLGSGGTNTFIDVANCQFFDGNASALNLTFGSHIHGCTFNRMVKVSEIYESYATLPTVYENNTWTNIISNALSIGGSVTAINAQPFTICNNSMSDWPGSGFCNIQLSASENIVISNNDFYAGHGIDFTSVGTQVNPGYTPTTDNNIVIANNRYHGQELFIYIQDIPVVNLLVSNNVGGSIQCSGGQLTNVVYSGNQSMGYTDMRTISAGMYPLDVTNNSFATYVYDADSDWFSHITNVVTYGLGRFHQLATTGANVFFLDNTNGMTPVGAVLQITNYDVWHDHYPVRVQTAINGGATYMIPTNSLWTFYWNGSSWQTGALMPPQGLKVMFHQ